MRARIFGGLGTLFGYLVGGRTAPADGAAVRKHRRARLTELLLAGARAPGKRAAWLLRRASAVLRTLEEADAATCRTDAERRRCSLGRAYHAEADRWLTRTVLGGAAGARQTAVRHLWTAASYVK